MFKNTIEINSLNKNKHIYNYKYNLIISEELYHDDDIEYLAKKYYHQIKVIGKDEFINNKRYEKYRCLGLVLTDKCNFRCSYCANSSAYEYSKGYKENSMSYDILNKALELYIKEFKENIKRDPNVKFSIMFYGGEPLLEFEKIKYTVKMVEDIYKISNPIYTITTNGFLINDEMLNLFKSKNFDVNISMDGYKEIHNQNRKTIGGQNTFDKVVKNFRTLYDFLGVDKVGILTTFDTQVSPRKLFDFYDRNRDIDKCLRRVSSVSTVNTSYYDSIKQYDKYDEELNYLYSLYHEGNNLNFLKMLYNDKFLVLTKRREFLDKTFALCSPINAKLTVSVNGDLHICEKVNENYPIGNVYDGIDKEKAYNYYKNIVDIRSDVCSFCEMRNLCVPCFANLCRGGKKFQLMDSQCDELKRGAMRMLELYCTFLDKEKWPKYNKKEVIIK